MERLTDTERLAIAQALYNMAGKLVSTKDPDSLRSSVDEGFKELYEQTGSKSFDVKVNGMDVGTYSIQFTKPKESETRMVFVVEDYEKLAKWFKTSVSHGEIEHYVACDLKEFAEWQFNHTGEMPDGCNIRETIIPAVEKEYNGGRLKIDPEKVASAIRNVLPGGIFGILEG